MPEQPVEYLHRRLPYLYFPMQTIFGLDTGRTLPDEPTDISVYKAAEI